MKTICTTWSPECLWMTTENWAVANPMEAFFAGTALLAIYYYWSVLK